MPTEPPNDTTPTFEGSLHQFESSTVWGKVKVVVQDTAKGFQVGVQSDASVSGWILKDDQNGRVVSKGGISPSNRFQFETGTPFKGAFRLILDLDSDDQQTPVVIRLTAGKADETGKTAVEGLEEYQDNPDHPYHAMVKNLYDQATASYSKGDNLHALDFLKKAEQLDPLQPQVQDLIDKIRGPSEKADDPLEKVKDALKKDKKEEALAKVMDYLDQHPDDEEALALKDKIEDKANEPKPKPTVRPKKTSTEKSPIQESDQERQAKADQVYNLGLDSYRKGDLGAAKKFWEETLEIEPTHAQAQRNLDRLKEEHPELK